MGLATSEETDEEAAEETKREGFRFTTGIMNAVWRYARKTNHRTMKEFWAEMRKNDWDLYDVLEAESP